MFGGKEDLLAAYDAGGGNSGKVCFCDREDFALAETAASPVSEIGIP